MFRTILIDKDPSGGQTVGLVALDEARLPAGDVTVRVSHSTLNYKDALAITGRSPVVRAFPMVPGIDLAGTVEASTHAAHRAGDRVLINGWGIGEKTWGGLAEKARVNGDWLVPVPERFTQREAMAIGTAGFTAMLALMALEQHQLSPARGPVLVTGASGGVGSFAVSLLSRAGYRVIASTGRLEQTPYLKRLGADEVIERQQLARPGRPLEKEQWAGAIDSVGSYTLANVCAGTSRGGAVAACGLAQGMDFPATVAPFILRGVSLLGIDSVECPQPRRLAAWSRLASMADATWFEDVTREISLAQVIEHAALLLDNQVRGRLVVDVNAT